MCSSDLIADIVFDPKSGLIASHGLQVHKLKMCILPQRLDKTKPVLEELRFVPYAYVDQERTDLSLNLNIDLAIKFFTDLILENCSGNRIHVQENVNRLQNALAPSILKWVRCQPLREAEISLCLHSTQTPDTDAGTEAWIKEHGQGIQLKFETAAKAKNQYWNHEAPNLFVTNSIADLASAGVGRVGDFIDKGPRFILLHTDQAPVAISTVPGYIRVAEKRTIDGHDFLLYGKASTRSLFMLLRA